MDLWQLILNKPANQFFTGVVSSISPLQVKIYPLDGAINCKSTTGLLGLCVGSNVILMKIGSQFIITQIIGSPFVDSILLNMDTTQYITDTNQTNVAFNVEKLKIGTRLSFDSTNHGVKIGKGVNHVEIYMNLWVERYIDAYSAIYLKKNDTELSYNIHTYLTGFHHWVSMNDSIITSVTENDIIYGSVRFSGADVNNNVGGGYPDSCNLIVKVID